jgi:hydroxymethylbilane synthase
MWQATWVASQLERDGHSVEIVNITTSGDTHSVPLGVESGQGVFTKEIQRALLDGRVDLAVHSLKDLPTESIDGLRLAVVPRRASNLDCLVSKKYASVADLPRGAKVGTGSARRVAQLLHERPDLQMHNIRGNVGTRLSKLDAGQYDAILLAEAGLVRLGFEDRIGEIFAPCRITPAVGQGALALEIRESDHITADAIRALDDCDTHVAVRAEREMLRQLRGGCLAPVGGWARLHAGRLVLLGVVCSLDGGQRLRVEVDAAVSDAQSLGQTVAERLKSMGSDRLLADARGEDPSADLRL